MKSYLKTAPYTFYIDTGGTFTDCLAMDHDGNTQSCKVLSNSSIRGYISSVKGENIHIKIAFPFPDHFFNGYQFRILGINETGIEIKKTIGESSAIIPDQPMKSLKPGTAIELVSPEESPLLAIRLMTQTTLTKKLPSLKLRLSTTKGTNALLERRGGKTVFFITEGFKDLLHIKNQQRPDLFSLNIQKPEPFYTGIIEVPERLDSNGTVIKEPDWNHIREKIKPFIEKYDAAAICLMHSYKNPDHEIKLESLLRETGINFISRSSGLSSSIKILPRAITTDVNAYLTPVMQNYLNRISEVIGTNSLQVMSSAGSLVEADHYSPKDGLFSGPAGGVIGAVAIGKRTGHHKIISFDMGGTSTDVARFDGELDYEFEHSVGDATLAAPAIAIETVAAGGGSFCGYDGQSLTVGPGSAGADPGPACYGRGGPLTLTDVNLLSGRLHPSNFGISIKQEAAETAFHQLMDSINKNRESSLSENEVLDGFLDIANERMAHAIRKISIQKGFDPSEYVMVAFGGAGAQHALAVAEKLNIGSVLVPSDAGLLSAYGLQQAKPEQIVTRQILNTVDQVKTELPSWFDELCKDARSALLKQGIPESEISIKRKQIHLRLKGQDFSLELEWDGSASIAEHFREAYKSQYGHWIEGRETEVEAIRVIASQNNKKQNGQQMFKTASPELSASSKASADFKNKSFRIFNHDSIKPGTEINGPAIILDSHSTTIIESGWNGNLLEDGTWLIKSLVSVEQQANQKSVKRDEAVNLQLYTNRFRALADQMGEILLKTALSVNVKERLDFSCALLDADGYLVVNAPHIPVHLGAMGTCVRTLIQHFGQSSQDIEEGDVLITNHPGFGGSHLPDVTVITPVFYSGKRIAFVASRAHHAEIGGSRPGSMPPDATSLAEEGVVIPPMFLAKKGIFNWAKIDDLLKNSPWPSRAALENMADIQAAVSANYRGVAELTKLADTFGVHEVTGYMKQLRTYASERMKMTLKKIPDGTYKATEILDDGSNLSVSCVIHHDSLSVDFSGTSGVHPGNLNANPSIVKSVIMYVLRLMIDEPLPLNDGLLEPVEIILPPGMLNPDFSNDPKKCPAVVGGNIEVSQRLTDTLIKAFRLSACSYGTMNNVLFGNNTFGYYETVAGGTGAGDGFDGADAVHQHMTNTRAADPEILEHRYPVILDRYEIRRNSGGNGKWRGGDGIIRELTFLEPVSLSVLTQHRSVAPYGLNGGKPGRCGNQQIIKENGEKILLEWKDGAELEKGDRFILETPGGGGFGQED